MVLQVQSEYVQFIRHTCWYMHHDKKNAGELAYLALGVAGEAGEFADAIKKIVRESGFENKLAFDELLWHKETMFKVLNELGDNLWYITRILDVLGFTLDDLMLLNTEKLHSRLIRMDKIELGEQLWPNSNFLFVAASRSIQHIESRIMDQSASISTAIDTELKQHSRVPLFKGVSKPVWSWILAFSKELWSKLSTILVTTR